MSNTDEMLTQMRTDKDQAADKPKVGNADPEQYYVRLVIQKLRRQQVTVSVAFGFCVFVSVLARDYGTGRAWWLTGLPIGVLGLMIALIPPSEEWEYKPWQARARQYERNQ